MAESDAEVGRQIAMGLLRVVNKINQGRRTPRSYGAGPPMTMLEAEMCFLISHHSGVTGSELSQQLGVTRSAMSQTIAKLKQKGFVVEVPDPSDSKRKKLFVTPLGRRAADVADDYARAMASELFDTSRAELDSYLRLVSKWEAFLDAARDKW
ncbi:MarR family winged helix-turn-helix transcriptional regulator [Nocardia sp. BMG51109]|uniref:MarR family winged helix-turn-helix transcriptional regulator n=1 Tax=Nocardia sp. BMG51109 TaxID=1056816 RepID=UPI0004B2C9F9|nr:MarR family winged helix-turn-helix transcriptional regulator [Nocardia sp. BMG51109]